MAVGGSVGSLIIDGTAAPSNVALTLNSGADLVFEFRNAAGSMPIGNGEVGLNVWVEPSGDLLFYIARTDAWSECNRLLKLGRIRVRITPMPLNIRYVEESGKAYWLADPVEHEGLLHMANRDAAVFDDPDRMDVGRAENARRLLDEWKGDSLALPSVRLLVTTGSAVAPHERRQIIERLTPGFVCEM